MQCFSALILLVSVMRSANGQDGPAYKYTYITIGKNRTVTLLLQHERDIQNGTVDGDPIPDGLEYTDWTTLIFHQPVEVYLTLTNLTAWRNTITNQPDAPKLVLEKFNTKKKLVWMTNDDNETWTEVESDSCPYLYVNRITFSKSFKVSPLVLKKTITFNANTVQIQLKDVPSNEWCAINIQFTASLLPDNYCQSGDKFYCNESLQCLNVSAWCDGNTDCDLGEDELNCPQGFTAEASVNQALVYGLVGLTAAIVIAVAFVAICYSLKQHRNRHRLSSILHAKENHEYDYPTFSGEAYPLSMRESSASSKNVETELEPPSRTYTVAYDTCGIYSHVITASNAK